MIVVSILVIMITFRLFFTLKVSYVTSGCYTDETGYPLTYLLAVVIGTNDSKLETVMCRSTAATDTFIGKSTWDGSENATYVMKVYKLKLHFYDIFLYIVL